MVRYWRSPDFLFRDDHNCVHIYNYRRGSFRISAKFREAIERCCGIEQEELLRAMKVKSNELLEFLEEALSVGILTSNDPSNVGRYIKRGFSRPYCMSSPDGIFFEVTYRCNLRCRHCYVNCPKPTKEMTTSDILKLLDEASNLGVGVISLGGGEPLLREDIFKIIKHGHELGLTMVMITNGTCINSDIVTKLKQSGLRYVGVSLDGARATTHDRIRGASCFDKVIRAIRLLAGSIDNVFINFTVSKVNMAELESAILLAKQLGVYRFRALRLMPAGSALSDEGLWLTPELNRIFVTTLSCLHQKYSSKEFRIDVDETLLPLVGVSTSKRRMSWLSSKYYGCPAARSFCFITPDGNVYPCGYLEFPKFRMGNILSQPLSEIWERGEENVFVRSLRCMKYLNPICDSCPFIKTCQGGCRAAAYVSYGSLSEGDPMCWRYTSLKGTQKELVNRDNQRGMVLSSEPS